MQYMKDGKFTVYEQNQTINVLKDSLKKAAEDAVCEAFGVRNPDDVTFDKVSELSLKFNSK